MSWLTSIFGRWGPSSPISSDSSWLVNAFAGRNTTAGIAVNEQTALSFSAVYACVRILAETIAQLPLNLHERIDEDRSRKATDRPEYWMLHDEPNPYMTSFVFRETLMAHIATCGNAYAEIERDDHGNAINLWPLSPYSTYFIKDRERITYYTIVDGVLHSIEWENMLHIPGLGFDGYRGYSPIWLAKNAVGAGLATEEFAARFFSNGASSGVILTHPGVGNAALSDKAISQIRKKWQEDEAGLTNAHRVRILREGMDIKPFGIPPEDAQFLETRKFQISEIARFYRIQLHKLQEMDRATFSNIEQQSMEFVTDTMMPWIVRWEQTVKHKLFLNPEDRRRFFVKFNVAGLLRGDAPSRAGFYSVMTTNGIMTRNEARALEDWEPLPGLDEPLQPLNMASANNPNGKPAENTRKRIEAALGGYLQEMKELQSNEISTHN